jgi:hypothetical protein
MMEDALFSLAWFAGGMLTGYVFRKPLLFVREKIENFFVGLFG